MEIDAERDMWKFLFGEQCPHCRESGNVHRWSRYDGTGSWRMHQWGHYESFFCERNGWFSRHWFITRVLIGAPSFLVMATLIGGLTCN